MRPIQACCVAVFFVFFGVVSTMAGPQRVDLEPIAHENAELVVVNPDGSRTVYTPAQLEEFPTYRLVTTTPWRVEPAAFSGVLLSDILERHEMPSDMTIRVTAENEFSTFFDPEALGIAPILVATRVDGAAHSRRARGPIQFVIEDEVYRSNDALTESHLVWMASRIEVVR
ncbi:MAG: hypothetical protein HKP37_11700 [Boseongicola sp.]|nr:hypothetical protein [Boseongicola sp.]NNL19394.1 hypothetical protein [Boseongicola sp.]